MAPVGVPVGQVGAHVFFDPLLAVLTLAEPPEPLGPGGEAAHHILVLEELVAFDDHLADRDAIALDDVEDDPDLIAVLRKLEDLHFGRVVAPLPVHGVDCRARALHGGAIQRPAGLERHLAADRALLDPVGAAQRPVLQQRALLHDHVQHEGAGGVALLDPDVVELAGPEQRGDGALDRAVVGGLSPAELGVVEHLPWGVPDGAFDDQAVDDRRRRRRGRLLGKGPGSARAEQRGEGEEEAGGTRHGFGQPRAPLSPGSLGWGSAQARDGLKARNASLSPSGARSTSISSPRTNSPVRIFSLSGSSMYRWMARLSGRAP